MQNDTGGDRYVSALGTTLLTLAMFTLFSFGTEAQQQDKSPPKADTAVAPASAGAVSTAAATRQSASAEPSLVFDGVTVVDVDQGKLVPGQRVVITKNRIEAAAQARTVTIPKGARVVDARGKYLIPGLWDMHSHARQFTDYFYPWYLAYGVTGIRDAGSPVPLDTLRLRRREILAGTRIGPPRQLFSGQSIAGPEPGCERRLLSHKTETCVTDSADARHYVDSLKKAGADLIKPRAVTPAMFFVLAAEARRVGLPFGGHTRDVPPIQASDSGVLFIDHGQPHDKAGIAALCYAHRTTASVEQCQAIAERFRRNGTWVVLDAASLLLGKWGKPGRLRIIHDVGLPIVAGSDVMVIKKVKLPNGKVPPRSPTHAIMEYYVKGGLTPLEALRTATLNPAKALRATDSLGTVAPGKLADLVLLDADPLADITNAEKIRAVVANGRYFDRTALDGVLAGLQAKYGDHP